MGAEPLAVPASLLSPAHMRKAPSRAKGAAERHLHVPMLSYMLSHPITPNACTSMCLLTCSHMGTPFAHVCMGPHASLHTPWHILHMFLHTVAHPVTPSCTWPCTCLTHLHIGIHMPFHMPSMHACTHTYLDTPLHALVHITTCTCICLHTAPHIFTHALARTPSYPCTHPTHTCTSLHICTRTCMCLHTPHTHMPWHICTCSFTFLCTYITHVCDSSTLTHTCAPESAYTCTSTHTCTHPHTCVYSPQCLQGQAHAGQADVIEGKSAGEELPQWHHHLLGFPGGTPMSPLTRDPIGCRVGSEGHWQGAASRR